MKTSQKKKRCYVFSYEGVVDGQKCKTKPKKLRFWVRDIFRQRKQCGEYSRLVQELKNWRSGILFQVCLHTFHIGYKLISLYVHYSLLYYENLLSHNPLTVSGEKIVLCDNNQLSSSKKYSFFLFVSGIKHSHKRPGRLKDSPRSHH